MLKHAYEFVATDTYRNFYEVVISKYSSKVRKICATDLKTL